MRDVQLGKVKNKEEDKRIAEIFKRLQQKNPEPKTELEYTTPFTLLVAVVLSAQATDKGVNKATQNLFAIADTPQAFLELGEEGLCEWIKSIGLYRTKAKNIIALSRQLIERWDGQVPEEREALESLPGVGRKTANVVLNVLYGKETIPVDTHVFRVAHRLNLSKGKSPLAVEKELEAIVPHLYRQYAHHWLILHGRYICQARRPKCEVCCLQDLCPSAFLFI